TDMDSALTEWIAREFQKESGIDVRKDKMAMQRVRDAAEKAKIELSSTLETQINLPFLSATPEGPKHLALSLSRAQLEELIRPVIERCRGPVEQALADAKLEKGQIDRIVLVGGPTRMPIVQKTVEQLVGPSIERGVDPMECVAMGAAIQAGVLAGEVKDVLLLDVTPLSLGVETLGGVFTKLIERNTTIPTRKAQIFTTAADSQNSVEIKVFQGERPLSADNVSLGSFMLTGIPPAPRGTPQVEVSFDIDANGILNVSAKDLATGKKQGITITASTKLSKEEVDRMVHQAEEFAAKDRERAAAVEARNRAETLAYDAERLLADGEGKISEADRQEITQKVAALRTALGEKDLGVLKERMDDLTRTLHAVAQRMYEAGRSEAGGATSSGQGGGGPATPSGGRRPGETPVDADFKVVDKEPGEEKGNA
ncbi:MAG TPA: Hsp70 family protein, partial [Thermoplasmata archaeon]|nr:Hsp70 family protein [Thermoplasmata archaeon]